MASYRVIAPYVTLKVRDHNGAWVLQGFYRNAIATDVDPDSLRHHLDNELVEEVVEAEPAPEQSQEEPEQSKEEAREPLPRPHGNASAAAWLDYAVSLRPAGVSEEDARAELSGKTKAELVAEYGN